MTGFNKSNIDDALYDALNQSSLTSLLSGGSSSIFHKKPTRNEDSTKPCVIYYLWDDLFHEYTMNKGRSSVIGAYRITAWTEDDPRGAETIAAAIDNLLTNTTFSVTTYGLLVCRCKRSVSRVQEHDDTLSYHEAGGIYEIGVTL